MAKKHVFVVGDSISLHYTPDLIKELADDFTCERQGDAKEREEAAKNLDIPKGANCGDSDMVLALLRYRREHNPVRADYLLLNCGLHDIKSDLKTGEKQVTADRYRQNLKQIVAEARAMGTVMVWVNTTPVDDKIHNGYPDMPFYRYAADVQLYNEVAAEVMAELKIPTIDLYSFSEGLLPEGFMDHVHFTEDARAKQAAFIAAQLRTLDEAAV